MDNLDKISFSVFSSVDGKKYRIVVREQDLAKLSVNTIKKNLLKATGMPLEEQRLSIDGSELDDSWKATDFGLCDQILLTLNSIHPERNLHIQPPVPQTPSIVNFQPPSTPLFNPPPPPLPTFGTAQLPPQQMQPYFPRGGGGPPSVIDFMGNSPLPSTSTFTQPPPPPRAPTFSQFGKSYQNQHVADFDARSVQPNHEFQPSGGAPTEAISAGVASLTNGVASLNLAKPSQTAGGMESGVGGRLPFSAQFRRNRPPALQTSPLLGNSEISPIPIVASSDHPQPTGGMITEQQFSGGASVAGSDTFEKTKTQTGLMLSSIVAAASNQQPFTLTLSSREQQQQSSGEPGLSNFLPQQQTPTNYGTATSGGMGSSTGEADGISRKEWLGLWQTEMQRLVDEHERQRKEWQQEKEKMKISFDERYARLAEQWSQDRDIQSRAWSSEKSDLLKRTSEEKDYLAVENERLKREMKDKLAMMASNQLGNKDIAEQVLTLTTQKELLERELASTRAKWAQDKAELVKKLSVEKESLVSQVQKLTEELETERKNAQERRKTFEIELLAERTMYSGVTSQSQQEEIPSPTKPLSETAKREVVPLASKKENPTVTAAALFLSASNATPASLQVQQAIEEERRKFAEEKESLNNMWKEETEILTAIWQEDKNKWELEKQDMFAEFESQLAKSKEETKAALEDQQRQMTFLEEQLNTALAHSEALENELSESQRDNVESKQFVTAARRAIEELRQNMQQFNRGDLFMSEQLVRVTAEKAAEWERAERMTKESESLTARLKQEITLRRQLHNAVEDIKGSIRVVVRVRPQNASDRLSAVETGSVEVMDEGTITCSTPSAGSKSFEFYRVLPSQVTQEQVFDEIRPLIQSAFDGFNVCIFSYGQTGTGKTYTIYGESGSSGAPSTTPSSASLISSPFRGIVPRSLEELFRLLDLAASSDNISYHVKCNMVELYLDNIRDLLDPETASRPPPSTSTSGGGGGLVFGERLVEKKLELRVQPGSGAAVIPGLTQISVRSASDILKLLNTGSSLRQVHSTAMNEMSSRSHTVFTVRVEVQNRKQGTVTTSKLVFVDLAGSERISKSLSSGERMKEAQHINKSLSALGDVICALSTKEAFVPYRNSKLTTLLQDSLGGNSKTVLFANVAPSGSSVPETISTLLFASRVKHVKNPLVKNLRRLTTTPSSS